MVSLFISCTWLPLSFFMKYHMILEQGMIGADRTRKQQNDMKLLAWRRVLSISSTFEAARFMGPTWGPPGTCWPQVGPMLAPWTLLSRIPSSMHMMLGCVLLWLCAVVVWCCLVFPMSLNLLHWHWGNLTIVTVSVWQPWRICDSVEYNQTYHKNNS